MASLETKLNAIGRCKYF